jgi:Uma2 family endonuclease
MSSKTLLTADELEQMPDDDSVQIELDEGELITTPPAGWEHGRIEMLVGRILGNYAQQHRLGEVLSGDTGFAHGAPDRAIEIFSPSDSVRQLMRKVKQYFAAGCHTVWIVYPDKRELQILEVGGTDRLLKAADLLEAPELLPGFSVPVSSFFG